MTIYKAFLPDVEVNKQTISSVVNALPVGEKMRKDLLFKNGIDFTTGNKWFSQQLWLNCFSEMERIFGETFLFVIGKGIPDNACFPEIFSFEDALKKLDIAYHMNHRINGKIMYDESTDEMMEGIGHYTLDSFDESKGRAIMICDNPYPSRFDLGIITRLAEKYSTLNMPKVYLDATKETRLTGGKSCTYIIEF